MRRGGVCGLLGGQLHRARRTAEDEETKVTSVGIRWLLPPNGWASSACRGLLTLTPHQTVNNGDQSIHTGIGALLRLGQLADLCTSYDL